MDFFPQSHFFLHQSLEVYCSVSSSKMNYHRYGFHVYNILCVFCFAWLPVASGWHLGNHFIEYSYDQFKMGKDKKKKKKSKKSDKPEKPEEPEQIEDHESSPVHNDHDPPDLVPTEEPDVQPVVRRQNLSKVPFFQKAFRFSDKRIQNQIKMCLHSQGHVFLVHLALNHSKLVHGGWHVLVLQLGKASGGRALWGDVGWTQKNQRLIELLGGFLDWQSLQWTQNVQQLHLVHHGQVLREARWLQPSLSDGRSARNPGFSVL